MSHLLKNDLGCKFIYRKHKTDKNVMYNVESWNMIQNHFGHPKKSVASKKILFLGQTQTLKPFNCKYVKFD